LLVPLGGLFYKFQRIIGGGAIDNDVFGVVIGLAVYRCQATGDVGGTVVCSGDDGNFHCW